MSPIHTKTLKALNDFDLQKLFGEDGFVNTMRNLKLEDYKKKKLNRKV